MATATKAVGFTLKDIALPVIVGLVLILHTIILTGEPRFG